MIFRLLVMGLPVAFGVTAAAVDLDDRLFQPVQFECRVIHAEAEFEVEFVTEEVGSAHGAPEHEFKSGNNTYYAMANGKWMGLTWLRDGKIVSRTVTLQTHPSLQHRVLLAYNPKSDEEYVTLDCVKQENP